MILTCSRLCRVQIRIDCQQVGIYHDGSHDIVEIVRYSSRQLTDRSQPLLHLDARQVRSLFGYIAQHQHPAGNFRGDF